MRSDATLSIAVGMALMVSACSPTAKSAGGSSNPQSSPSGSAPIAGGGPPGQSPNGSASTSQPPATSAPAAPRSSSPSRSSSGRVPSTAGGAQERSPLKGTAAASRTAAESTSITPNSSGGPSNPPGSTSTPVPGAAATPEPTAGSASSGVASAGTGNELEGRKIYVTKCVACHKADGSGGVKFTGNPTPDWRNPEHMLMPGHGDAAMRDCITNGRPKSGMMAWVKSGLLKPAQVEDLIAYIHTFSKKK